MWTPLERLCFMSRVFIRAGGIYSCVQLFIPHFVPRCCKQTTGQTLPLSRLSISSGHFFCVLCRQKNFFSSSAFLFPNCHWIVDAHMYIGRSRNLLMCGETYHNLPSSTGLSFPCHLPCHLAFGTSLSGLLKLMPKYLPFMKVPSFYPTSFPCLLSSCAMSNMMLTSSLRGIV